jgi:hypothetical protein
MIALSRDKLDELIEMARAFDAQVPPEGDEEGSNASDDREVGVLEDTPDNPMLGELRGLLDGLNDDEIIEILALTWLGRGDYTAKEWAEAIAAAREAHDEHVVRYLLETPNLGDLLAEGLAELEAID